MPLQITDKERADAWSERLQKSDDFYENWATKFKVQQCEQYYEGFQWKNQTSQTDVYSPYVINLVFSSIEVKLPSLLFEQPIVNIKPKPAREVYNSEQAFEGARIKEDVLNTFLLDEDNGVADEIELAVIDSFFRFGLMEVGYSADYVRNPNANKPILKENGEPYTTKSGKILAQPDEIPITERNYIKRINPKHFRVGGYSSHKLDRCSWVGYYDFYCLADLKANKNYKNLDKIDFPSGRSNDYLEYDDLGNISEKGDLCKVWHIWDLRPKNFILLASDQGEIIFEESFDRLPLFPLLFHKRLQGFYPLPPVFNWLHPQNEINESREMMRIHRRRFLRKYVYDKSRLNDPLEMDKLENGVDGTFVGVEGSVADVVLPVPNADLGASANQSMIISKDDFNIISATSSEARGEADRTTATATREVAQRAAVRENRSSKIVARWLKQIFKELLLQMKEKNVLPFWILKTEGVGDIETWNKIVLSEMGDDFDFSIDIDITSMSPIAQQEDKNKFLEFLAVLHNYPYLAMSPDLVIEAANRLGYKNKKVINQFVQMATLAMIGQVEAGKQALGALAQRTTAQATPSDQEQITNQLTNQVGLPQ